MSLETTFPTPEEYGFLQPHGRRRIVEFVIKRFSEPPRAVVFHLNYPGVSVESEVSPTYSTEAGSTVRNHLSIVVRPLYPFKQCGPLVPSAERPHPNRTPSDHLQHQAHLSLRSPQLTSRCWRLGVASFRPSRGRSPHGSIRIWLSVNLLSCRLKMRSHVNIIVGSRFIRLEWLDHSARALRP